MSLLLPCRGIRSAAAAIAGAREPLPVLPKWRGSTFGSDSPVFNCGGLPGWGDAGRSLGVPIGLWSVGLADSDGPISNLAALFSWRGSGFVAVCSAEEGLETG